MNIIKERLIYKTINNIQLSVNIFRLNSQINNDLLPALVFFHGGGWIGGNPEQFFPQCEYFAKRGLIALSAEYRLRNKHNATPIDSMYDGKSLICWIRSNSLDLNIDPNKIIVAGGSAGGYIALSTALIDEYEPKQEVCLENSKPNAMILFNPVVNTVLNPRIASFFGKNKKKMSPVHNIKENLPPTIIFHGTRDRIIPFEDVEDFSLKMRQSGNNCNLVPFERKGHAFFNFGAYKNRPFTETLRLADRFLNKLGYLKGDPNL